MRQCAADYLGADAAAIWPGAVKDGAFDWNVLFDPSGRVGRDRLRAQYVSANVARDRPIRDDAGRERRRPASPRRIGVREPRAGR